MNQLTPLNVLKIPRREGLTFGGWKKNLPTLDDVPLRTVQEIQYKVVHNEWAEVTIRLVCKVEFEDGDCE